MAQWAKYLWGDFETKEKALFPPTSYKQFWSNGYMVQSAQSTEFWLRHFSVWLPCSENLYGRTSLITVCLNQTLYNFLEALPHSGSLWEHPDQLLLQCAILIIIIWAWVVYCTEHQTRENAQLKETSALSCGCRCTPRGDCSPRITTSSHTHVSSNQCWLTGASPWSHEHFLLPHGKHLNQLLSLTVRT